jgi:glycosyltransferase involved in cell wall biosynthesis
MLKKRALGKTGLRVSEVGLGGLFVSSFGAEYDQAERAIHRALALGINLIDTAPNYLSQIKNDPSRHMGDELARQFDVTVFTPKRLADEADEEEHSGFRVYRLRDALNREGRFPNLGARTLMPGLLPKLLRGGFDVVQAFPSLNFNSLLAFAATRIMRTPLIFCSFDFLDYATLIREGGGRLDVSVIAGHVPSRREAYVLRRVEHIFAISQRELEFFRRFNPNCSYSPVPVRVDEYLEPSPSPRERFGIAPDEFVFLCLGRVSEIKGQDLALEAFISVQAEVPRSRFVIVGRSDYEEGFVAGMHRRVADAGIGGRVVFTGMVERPDVIAWLSHADAHVIPVRFMNSGAVVAETWAAGTVVIQSDAVDPNYVVDGDNGYVFRSESVDALADKMLAAYHNRAKLGAMAERGRRFVLENLTYERLVEIYAHEYRRLVPHAFD